MHPARPAIVPTPCAQCGAPLDALRAPELAAYEEGIVALCGPPCRKQLAVAREEKRLQTLHEHRHAPPRAPIGPTPHPGAQETTGHGGRWDLPPSSAIALCLCALTASALANYRLWATVATALQIAIAVQAIRHTRRPTSKGGWVAASLGPAAAFASITWAILGWSSGERLWPYYVNATAVVIAALARTWLDRRATEPVESVVQALHAPIPLDAKTPEQKDATALSVPVRTVPLTTLRRGDVIIVGSGDTVPADGTVQMGHAVIFTHPLSDAPVVRQPGDPVAAGARVVEGALRISVTALGNDRVLLRTAAFTTPGDGPGNAWASRIERFAPWAAAAGTVAAFLGPA
ncbi:MAG: cation-translocating P-type ATPase, partial [Myxococcales bacterium]|nr:cation-translocating P-type ATPase [Myxococcales bacterium]